MAGVEHTFDQADLAARIQATGTTGAASGGSAQQKVDARAQLDALLLINEQLIVSAAVVNGDGAVVVASPDKKRPLSGLRPSAGSTLRSAPYPGVSGADVITTAVGLPTPNGDSRGAVEVDTPVDSLVLALKVSSGRDSVAELSSGDGTVLATLGTLGKTPHGVVSARSLVGASAGDALYLAVSEPRPATGAATLHASHDPAGPRRFRPRPPRPGRLAARAAPRAGPAACGGRRARRAVRPDGRDVRRARTRRRRRPGRPAAGRRHRRRTRGGAGRFLRRDALEAARARRPGPGERRHPRAGRSRAACRLDPAGGRRVAADRHGHRDHRHDRGARGHRGPDRADLRAGRRGGAGDPPAHRAGSRGGRVLAHDHGRHRGAGGPHLLARALPR